MEINELTKIIIGCAIDVHKELGPGLLESVYEECLFYELKKAGLEVKRQVSVPIVYKGKKLDYDFKLDLLVEDLVILELKTVPEILPIYDAQILTYMKLAEKEIGFIMNFNVKLMKDGFKRYKI
jgi:GxxExxY protein